MNDTAPRKDFLLDPSAHNESGQRIAHMRWVTSTYGYHPVYPEGSREAQRGLSGARDQWAILCTVPGAIGPFKRIRKVTYEPWQGDAKDERWDA